MSEVTADIDPPQALGRPSPPARLPITEISQWVERFFVMAATLVMRFPEKAPELFAYQASIVRAERNYEPGRWVSYDRQFRREALARRDLNWSVPGPRLYSEAFTGRARAMLPVLPSGRPHRAVLSQEPGPPMAELVPPTSPLPDLSSQRDCRHRPGPQLGNDHSRNSAGISTRVVAGRPGVATPTPVGTA